MIGQREQERKRVKVETKIQNRDNRETSDSYIACHINVIIYNNYKGWVATKNKAISPRPTGIGFTHPKVTWQVGKADKNGIIKLYNIQKCCKIQNKN